MPFGLVISLACHAALLGWAYLSSRNVDQLPTPDTPSISAELITPSEFLRLKRGSEDAKALETKANDTPTEDDSKNDTKKPDNAPPPKPAEPPPQEVAKLEPTPPPEPVKPEPPPGPSAEEQRMLEQKILDDQKAAEEAKLKAEADAKRLAEEEAKQKAQEEAKKKAEEEAKKKAEEEARKKKLAEEARKKKAEEARKKAEADKKKFDPSKIASLLDKAPDDATPKALIDKDPKKKGQQAVGSSTTATALGKEAGTMTGTDSVLSAREQDLLKGMIKSQLAECWRLPGAGGGVHMPIVTLRWRMKPDGSLDGEPSVQQAPSDPAGQIAAETAMRAVRGCQPLRLPPEQYEGWKDIIWVFDPNNML
ncbi:MAG: cell envelope integrity protein TolA [Hyphomicrobium sp.]